jgi:hypothetical protein
MHARPMDAKSELNESIEANNVNGSETVRRLRLRMQATPIEVAEQSPLVGLGKAQHTY